VSRKYIQEIRNALGDRPDNPESIETLPKRGYRFVAPGIDERAADPDSPTSLPIEELAMETQATEAASQAKAPPTSGRLPEWLGAVKLTRDVPKGRSVRPSLRENYDFLMRTLWILARNDLGCLIRATLQALESEFCHVRKNSNDDSVHGKYCILRALPGGAMEGTRASFEWLLGEVAPQLWRRLDH
jgi:hypothetical protein